MPKTKPPTTPRRITTAKKTTSRARPASRKSAERVRLEQAIHDAAAAVFDLAEAEAAAPDDKRCIRRVRRALAEQKQPEFEDVAVTAETLLHALCEEPAFDALLAREVGFRVSQIAASPRTPSALDPFVPPRRRSAPTDDLRVISMPRTRRAPASFGLDYRL